MNSKKSFRHLKNVLGLLILGSLLNCERDDICATTTPTTPHLLIEFKDAFNVDEAKAVRRMNVAAEDNDYYIIYDKTAESIILPLKIDALNTINSTRFIITRDIDFDDDDDPETFSNTDIIEVTYTPELIYVSRACGYKAAFNEVNAFREDDASNWIIDIDILNPTINNEDEAHITIYH